MTRYRKKPVVIEAVRYGPGSCELIARWMNDSEHVVVDGVCGVEPYAIHTPEGIMNAMPGDWIIKGVKGEFYPCKPDIFEATYAPESDDARVVERPTNADLMALAQHRAACTGELMVAINEFGAKARAIAERAAATCPSVVESEGRCPTCDGTNPAHHPAVQAGGEVQLCENAWHRPTAAEIRAREAGSAPGVECRGVVERLKEWGDAALREATRERPAVDQREFYGRHAAFYEAASLLERSVSPSPERKP